MAWEQTLGRAWAWTWEQILELAWEQTSERAWERTLEQISRTDWRKNSKMSSVMDSEMGLGTDSRMGLGTDSGTGSETNSGTGLGTNSGTGYWWWLTRCGGWRWLSSDVRFGVRTWLKCSWEWGSGRGSALQRISDLTLGFFWGLLRSLGARAFRRFLLSHPSAFPDSACSS